MLAKAAKAWANGSEEGEVLANALNQRVWEHERQEYITCARPAEQLLNFRNVVAAWHHLSYSASSREHIAGGN